MLSTDEFRRIYRQAYIPEHLPQYVAAISGAQPHVRSDYLYFCLRNHLTFIGYPLGNQELDPAEAFQSACDHFKPASATILAPRLWPVCGETHGQVIDDYYRLDFPPEDPGPQTAYMLRRAARDLSVRLGKFEREHRKLIKAFIAEHAFSREHKRVFKRIPDVLAASTTARLLEARKRKVLVAFTVVELGSADFGFHLFNIRTRRDHVPGASDLLFREMVNLVYREGKRAVNLGLGINLGVRRFKEKWGGRPFLPYRSATVDLTPVDYGKLLQKL